MVVFWRTYPPSKTDAHVSAGFEPAIPASERPQSHALDRAATVSDVVKYKADQK